MSKLELGLRLEVLGFKAAPPLGKATKGEEYKTQEPFCLVNVCFFLFFYIVFFFLVLLLFCIYCFHYYLLFTLDRCCLLWHVAFRLMLLLVHCPSPCVTICVVHHLALLLFARVHEIALLLFVVVPHFMLLLFVVVLRLALLLLVVISCLALLLLVIVCCLVMLLVMVHCLYLMLMMFVMVLQLALLLLVMVRHPCLALLLFHHSTLFLNIHLTLPCVVATCCGSSLFALGCCYLFVEVMYSAPLLPCVGLELGMQGVVLRK